MNLNLIKEYCDVHAIYTTPNGHTVVWYDDVCESDFVDEGEALMWSCSSEEEFNAYCEDVLNLEAPIDWDEPSDLEVGFNPYSGCYDWDC